MRMNEPTIRLTDSAFRGHTRMYDVDILYYDSPESDIHRLFTNNDDERSDEDSGSLVDRIFALHIY